MKYLAWTLICLLVLLHQCTIPWQSERLWLGFIPGLLGYHLAITLAAAGAWALVVKYAWPDNLENHPPEAGDP